MVADMRVKVAQDKTAFVRSSLSVMVVAALIAGLMSQPARAASDALDQLSSFSESCVTDDSARATTLREYGLMSGSALGFSERAVEIHAESAPLLSNLQRIINFSRFVSKDGWMPPVIEHVKSSFEVTDGKYAGSSSKATGEKYKIIEPARFVMAPPTVRDYLFIGLDEKPRQTDPLPSSLKPKNEAEMAIWKAAVIDGYADGVALADAVLEENVRKMRRAYFGMMTYSSLQKKNMITKPVATSAPADTIITSTEISRHVENKEFAAESEFVTDTAEWQKEGYVDVRRRP